jgi:hypothetical protein
MFKEARAAVDTTANPVRISAESADSLKVRGGTTIGIHDHFTYTLSFELHTLRSSTHMKLQKCAKDPWHMQVCIVNWGSGIITTWEPRKRNSQGRSVIKKPSLYTGKLGIRPIDWAALVTKMQPAFSRPSILLRQTAFQAVSTGASLRLKLCTIDVLKTPGPGAKRRSETKWAQSHHGPSPLSCFPGKPAVGVE